MMALASVELLQLYCWLIMDKLANYTVDKLVQKHNSNSHFHKL